MLKYHAVLLPAILHHADANTQLFLIDTAGMGPRQ